MPNEKAWKKIVWFLEENPLYEVRLWCRNSQHWIAEVIDNNDSAVLDFEERGINGEQAILKLSQELASINAKLKTNDDETKEN